MKIIVRAKTGAREIRVEKIDRAHFTVSVKALPEKGRANAEIISALAAYFHIPKSHVKITSGHTAKTKLCEIVLK